MILFCTPFVSLHHSIVMEVKNLDLKNNKITVTELLNYPPSKAVFQRRFGRMLKHPVVAAGGSLTLVQVMEIAKIYLPEKTIEETLAELKKC